MDGASAVEAIGLHGIVVIAFPGVEWLGDVLLHPGVHPHPSEGGSAPATTVPEWTLALVAVLLVASIGGLLYWYYGRRGDAS